MDEDKVQEPFEITAMREVLDAARRSADAQERMLEGQIKFQQSIQPISIRDQFAMFALSGLDSASCQMGTMGNPGEVEAGAEFAYDYAYAMMRVRELEDDDGSL